jgi:predicted nucleotidyltransferase
LTKDTGIGDYGHGAYMTLQYLIDTLRANRNVLTEEFCVKSIGIFGSYALNQQTEDSDIDFLVEFSKPNIDVFEAKYQLKTYLQNLFHKEVDLTRSNYLKPFVKTEILSSTQYAI